MTIRTATGLAALLLTLWGLVMGSGGPYPFPSGFAHEITAPVLALELARDRGAVSAVSHGYDARAVRWLNRSTALDLVLIPLYVLFLVLLARLFQAHPGWCTIVAVAAGISDYVEDYFMYRSLAGEAPHQFAASVAKWSLLALAMLLLGARFLRGNAKVYSFATEALVGLLYLTAGGLVLTGTVLGTQMGYTPLELGTKIFFLTVPLHAVALLGPWVGRRFPGRDIAGERFDCGEAGDQAR